MKLQFLIVFPLAFSISLANAQEDINIDDLKISYFSESDISKGQCGCWYYFPQSEQSKGNVIAVGEAGEDSIYMIINGEKIMVGNWYAEYTSNLHLISYNSDIYRIDIRSTVIDEGRYSSHYNSVITVVFGDRQATVETWGSCGC